MKEHEEHGGFTFIPALLPGDYSKLCGILMPRPIHDRAGYENALELIEAMAGFEAEFTEDQNV